MTLPTKIFNRQQIFKSEHLDINLCMYQPLMIYRVQLLCYKDGPQLPALNFTITCTEYGRYTIFYNERLNGVTYPNGYGTQNVFTELCKVIVQGTKLKL